MLVEKRVALVAGFARSDIASRTQAMSIGRPIGHAWAVASRVLRASASASAIRPIRNRTWHRQPEPMPSPSSEPVSREYSTCNV